MPGYDVRFCRLHAIPASSPQGNDRREVWASEVSLPVELVPIDEPERCLIQVRLSEALTPGLYGVHWGALEGYTATDPRLFLFEVVDAAHGDTLPQGVPKAASPEPEKAAPAKTPEPAKGAKPEVRQTETEPPDTEAADAEAEVGAESPEKRP
jgi:hypothetical protein